MNNLEEHEVQILYTQIDTSATGEVIFTEYTFQLDENRYFYPASTVKLPAAVITMEWLEAQDSLTTSVPYGFKGDSLMYDLKSDYRAVFGLSDNDAYNRHYELLGRDYLNQSLRQKGIQPVRISHRLSTPNANISERKESFFWYNGDTVPVPVYLDGPIEKIDLREQQKGKGFMRYDSLIETPMNFSEKNYFPLQAQQGLLKRLFYPESFAEEQRFNINPARMTVLHKRMSEVPRALGYDVSEYYDSYVKFFMYGDTKDSIPHHIKIHNKVGYAYGTLTDNAYIVDDIYDVRFFLSATILVNENGIFNDDNYEYETIGVPFLAQLGREIYLYERQRKK